MNCNHEKIINDLYGASCQLCGEPLEGYGYNASNREDGCLHVWGETREGAVICIYCEIPIDEWVGWV